MEENDEAIEPLRGRKGRWLREKPVQKQNIYKEKVWLFGQTTVIGEEINPVI